MENVNKTLYIPLYGKAFVTYKGIILNDQKAKEIWDKEGFKLNGKAKSKWLAYFMAMRSAVIDEFVNTQINNYPNAAVLHLGCGLDSRVLRINNKPEQFYDIDFEEVIHIRKQYFTQSQNCHMIASDVRNMAYLKDLSSECAIIVMEGISMYLKKEEIKQMFVDFSQHFKHCIIIMDVYSEFAAKMSKFKNPINEVGVSEVYGIDDPKELENDIISFESELELTPLKFINELKCTEKMIFKNLYAGKFSKKLYKLYMYEGKSV